MHAGLKVFERNSNNSPCRCDHRVTQEGASLLLPHMRKRVVWLEPADFGLCVHGGQVFFEALSEEARAALTPLEPGALICACSPGAAAGRHAATAVAPLVVVTWRARGENMNVLCNKNELHNLSRRLSALGYAVPERPARPAGGAAAPAAAATGDGAADGGDPAPEDGEVEEATGAEEAMETADR